MGREDEQPALVEFEMPVKWSSGPANQMLGDMRWVGWGPGQASGGGSLCSWCRRACGALGQRRPWREDQRPSPSVRLGAGDPAKGREEAAGSWEGLVCGVFWKLASLSALSVLLWGVRWAESPLAWQHGGHWGT